MHYPFYDRGSSFANFITSSNLEDPEVKKEYERGYKTVLDFFHKHM